MCSARWLSPRHTLARCAVPDRERMRAPVAARYGCVFVEPFASATLDAEEARKREGGRTRCLWWYASLRRRCKRCMASGAHTMPLSTPAEAIPFHFVGYTWGSGRLELLWRSWPAGAARARSAEAAGETLRWAIVRGAVLDLAAVRPGVPGERRCIGYRPPEGGPQRPCPQWRALPAG